MDNRSFLHRADNYSIQGADRFGLGTIFLLNLFSRIKCGICGPNPVPGRPLIDAVQKFDPSYCIDAPDAIPAGGMSNFSIPPYEEGESPIWLSEQQLAYREQNNG